MNKETRDWTLAESAALRALGKASPPEDLEDEVVEALGGRGLLGPGPAAPSDTPLARLRSAEVPPAAWVLAAAAAVALFVAGWAIGRGGAPGLPEGERFMLLLYETESFDLPQESEEYARLAARYAGWGDSLREEGIPVVGDELMPSGTVVALDPQAVRGEPGLEKQEYLGGYMIVGAADLEAALELARTHPHLEYGGTIVVRPVVPTGDEE